MKTVEFGYDALNRRIGKRTIEAGTTTEESYIHHGEHIMATLSEGDVTRVIMHGTQIDMVLAEEVFNGGGTSTVSWTLTDHLGSIRDVAELDSVTGLAVITQHVDYTAFGEIASGNLSTLFSYTGRQFDVETGIYHYRARYYDAVLGRFISKDPIGFAAGDVNWYRYVGNHPSISRDPSGLQEQSGGTIPLNIDPSLLPPVWPNGPLEPDPNVIQLPFVPSNPRAPSVPEQILLNMANEPGRRRPNRNPANQPPYHPGNCFENYVYRINIPDGALFIIAPRGLNFVAGPHDPPIWEPEYGPYGPQDTNGHPHAVASTWPEVVNGALNHPDRPEGGWPAIVMSAHGSVNGGIRTGPRTEPWGDNPSGPRPDEMHIGGNISPEDAALLLSVLSPGAPIIFSACQQGRPVADPLEQLIDLFPGHPIYVQPGLATGPSSGSQPWVPLSELFRPSR